MRYRIIVMSHPLAGDTRVIVTETAPDAFTSFPAEVGNPVYDSFLESQGLTDAEVQALTPDEWHDMA
jgi:hypothetical protein